MLWNNMVMTSPPPHCSLYKYLDHMYLHPMIEIMQFVINLILGRVIFLYFQLKHQEIILNTFLHCLEAHNGPLGPWRVNWTPTFKRYMAMDVLRIRHQKDTC